MLTRDPSFEAEHPTYHGARVWAAALLRAASRWLDRLALGMEARSAAALDDTLAAKPPRSGALPAERHLEFHAEAGAPEGALYVDGRLVGHLPGVNRL